MATILLSAAGAAIGSGFGGTVLGLSGAVIGRAVGATVGRVLDQRLLGLGSEAVDSARLEQVRLTGATEGAPVAEVWGRVRVGGQIIWATRFLETANVNRGSKGGGAATTSYGYSISLALGLCKGVISGIGRVWADGIEIAPDGLNLRVYTGTEDQMPDPKIEAVQGAGSAPSYRGLAYVVVEDLDLGRFGNRVPQFSFEVIRPAQGSLAEPITNTAEAVRAVALIPGTGEYALATTPLHINLGPGLNQTANVHSASGLTDLATSLDALSKELPAVGSISLVVSWFGSDLRCGSCEIQPKCEPEAFDATAMPWTVSGATRSSAAKVPTSDGESVYGGTPTDPSVVEAIRAIKAMGKEVMFYPFVLMDQTENNGLIDPWSGAANQPSLPWRGRITLSTAPGRSGSPDRSAGADAEVAAFLGSAVPGDFSIAGDNVSYSGPDEWRFRRMILHYAHLCAAAGGVDSFIIGSELRGLTQIRGTGDHFPMVSALRTLAAEVKAILPDAEIGYAADWSEYFGYQVEDNVYFNLDPLWSDAAIDFVGIDNYMPLSDWRDGDQHADAGWESIYNIDYLKANIEGGEGYTWYYDSPEGAAYQLRKPIVDGAYGEDWIYRYKDIRNWWLNSHHERLGGIRQIAPTSWIPQSKPIRFTEYGCAALDKASNQPNLFLDPKSSESALPRASNGQRDDFIQSQYLRAISEYWSDPARNLVSTVYGGPMIDMNRCHVWAWDSRPYPEFPGQTDVWGDAGNYQTGHWLNGRSSNQPIGRVIAEICQTGGVEQIDISGAHGSVRGLSFSQGDTARGALQALTLAYGIDPFEREGRLVFRQRSGHAIASLDPDYLVFRGEGTGASSTTRLGQAEQFGRVRIGYYEADNDFDARSAESIFPDETSSAVSQTDLSMVLTDTEARAIAERGLSEARVARDLVSFSLPPSMLAIGAGDVVGLDGANYRIDRSEHTTVIAMDAVRVEPSAYGPGPDAGGTPSRSGIAAPLPVFAAFMDLPLISGDESPQAPHVAVTAAPWPGPVGVWNAATDDGYVLNTELASRSVIGSTETAMVAAASGVMDRGAPLRVKISAGQLSSASEAALLSGANLAAIGDGTPNNWELFQFLTATLVAPSTYELSGRLRGQFGTDGVMPDVWPVGSTFVLVDTSVAQLNLPASLRGIDQYYRVASRAAGYASPTSIVESLAFRGNGLRPYSVTALQASGSSGGTVSASWIRRTRQDGENWDIPEVPLGEATETYLVQVYVGTAMIREDVVGTPTWTYSVSQQAADGISGPFDIAIAQVSDRYGPGPFVRIAVSLP